MVDLSGAVDWWNEWQLRVLALGSLCAQYLLAFLGRKRKSRIPAWWRFSIWFSYLATDALAIYALAALFNRRNKLHSNPASHGDNHLEMLWAPILLMHIGGQVIITAYNIEDNELWKRHVVTVVAQVTVALYVFIKAWSSSSKRISAAAICILILATIRCLEKPWAFRRASFNNLITSFDRASRTTPSLEDQMNLQTYVQDARNIVQENNPPPELDFPQQSMPYFNCEASITKAHGNLFVDLPYPYRERLEHLKSFWLLDEDMFYSSIEQGLSNMFNCLYTKDVKGFLSHSFLGTIFVAAVCYALPGWPTTYHKLLDEGYSKSYVLITSFLLFFARNRRQTWLLRIATKWLCQDWMDQYWCLEPCDSSSIRALTELVRNSVKTWWTDRIMDADSYRKVNDVNGHWTLEREECKQMLEWSLENPFDENILIWHVATDFCLHATGTRVDTRHDSRSRCREISNYMMHLLFANPEMLMPGSRKNLLTAANKELDDMFKNEDPPVDTQLLMNAIAEKLRERSVQGFIGYSWLLAQGLMGLDEKMWTVIEGVWVEMLCFSASRSRGYLHAKSLGSGGEFLSYIWLLWAYAGMETFSERLQRRQHRQSRGDDDSGPSSSQCTNPVNAENASASSSSSKGKDPVKQEEDDAVPSTSQGMGPVKEDDNAASAASSSEGKGAVMEEADADTTQLASQREDTACEIEIVEVHSPH
ncbi:unnamed protein product [Urochloa decumbens]|uniref:DUF4220 domain-containing protein n=1 Tax=Urochloa decumbens TaxID=240449 RepID=A0ABC9GED8_9POAL